MIVCLLALLVTLLIPFTAYAGDVNSDLWLAAQRGETDKVEALLEQGADVNSKDKNGWTALMYAVAYGRHPAETLQLLLDKGADVNAKDGDGDTALIGAVRAVANLPDDFPSSGVTGADERVAAIVQALLNNGADVNAKNKKGETALTWAKIWADHFGGFKVVQLLEKAGAVE